MIDAHVHLRDWNQTEKETVMHGMTVGLQCGINCFLDMPNTNPAITDRETVIRRLELGKTVAQRLTAMSGVPVGYHLYGGLTADPQQIGQMVDLYRQFHPDICALKMFASQSTGNMGIVTEDQQLGIYKTLAELGYDGVLAVHCEKESLFDRGASVHSRIRPSVSEVESVRDQIRFAREAGFKGTLHIAHISTAGALELVKQAKAEGVVKVTCGATAHHILFNCDSESLLLKMNPPLRPESDRLAIWNGLFDNSVDWFESDHAPHTLEDKMKGASGIPGFQGTLVLIKKLRQAGMTEERLTQLLCTSAPVAFGIADPILGVPAQVSEDLIRVVGKAYPFTVWN